MADYIYLLENRLSPAQQRALGTVRTVVRAHDLTLFLTGGAVRDLTGGGPVRDLDITVQGQTTSLRQGLEAAGGTFTGEFAPSQSLFFVFPGGVRVEVSAAMSVTFPKPGKPVYELTSIGEDLRRRDFTANAMALSLNEGSYGLLMDPVNGVADIENRELRLVSNYGFLEDPARLVRAVRLSARLGWQMESRTQQRYENAKEDTDFAALSAFARGYEAEEIFHEEDPQRVMRALDAEGWLKKLAPQLALGKSNEAALAELREKQGQLQVQGVLADAAALAFPLLVAKLSAEDVSALKAVFARQGFVREIESLEERTREFQTRFNSKEAAAPSAAWRMLYDAEPALVLAMFYTGKGGSVQSRLKTFLTDSPTARQRLPYQMMQEMRITQDNPAYQEILDNVFFELMDGKLGTPEEMKAYLEPYSPPAPPPPLNLRRARTKKEPRPSRAKAKKAASTVVEAEEFVGVAAGLMEAGTLTGDDRGDTPAVHEPLEGKVAPLAPNEPESAAVKAPVKKTKSKEAVAVASSLAEVGSPAARKLGSKPAPAPEEVDLLPHPQATEQIARVNSAALTSARAKAKVPEKTEAAQKSRPVEKPVVVKPKAAPAKKAVVPAKAMPAKAVAKVPSQPAKATKPVSAAKVQPAGTKTVAVVKAVAAKQKPSAKKTAPAKKAAATKPALKAAANGKKTAPAKAAKKAARR